MYGTNYIRKIFINELNCLFNKLKLDQEKNAYVIAGDFNARRIEWGDHADNERGHYLRRWEANETLKYNAKIYTTLTPSRMDSHTFLDICITNLLITDLALGKINTCSYDRDHQALEFTIKLPNKMEYNNAHHEPYRFNYKATKWIKFANKLQSKCKTIIPENRNLTIDEVDEQIKDINQAILDIIEEVTPKL